MLKNILSNDVKFLFKEDANDLTFFKIERSEKKRSNWYILGYNEYFIAFDKLTTILVIESRK